MVRLVKRIMIAICASILLSSSVYVCQADCNIVDPSKKAVGDINADGIIDVMDALHILHISIGGTYFNSINLVAYADINGDLFVNAEDALIVLKKAARLIDEFPDISDTAKHKDHKYSMEEIGLYKDLINTLVPAMNSDGTQLTDDSGNLCYIIDQEKTGFDINSEGTNEAIVSWMCICTREYDDGPVLFLLGDAEDNLSVNAYRFIIVEDRLEYAGSYIRYKRDNLYYMDDNLFFMETAYVYPLGENPVEVIDLNYVN